MNFQFYSNCVNWPADDVDAPGGLCDLIDECEPITRRQFLRQVDRAELDEIARELGYATRAAHGLTMAGDWHISYFRSKHHGRTVYGFCWSAIEYVFTGQA